MSFIYYSLTDTFGPNLTLAQTQSQSLWTNPILLSQFLQFCTNLDFSNYDVRRQAIDSIKKLRLPQFYYTYPFDPLDLRYILVPPYPQTRFPSPGTFIYLQIPQWEKALQSLSIALSYRDSDGPIEPSQTAYLSALSDLDDLFQSGFSSFDRFEYETKNELLWSIYPPIPPIDF